MKKGIVINLRGGKERTEALKSAYKAVAECSERLRELSVELALKGVWKEWSDSKPIGTEYSFTYAVFIFLIFSFCSFGFYRCKQGFHSFFHNCFPFILCIF